jgi:signal transduction histidine kinase
MDKVMKYAILVLFLLFLSVTGISGAAPPKKTETVPSGDSIKLLDSLAYRYRVANDSLSLVYARREVVLSLRTGDPDRICRAWLSMALVWSFRRQDSSYYYNSLALKLSRARNMTKIRSQVMYNLAMLSYSATDLNNALLLLDSAIFLAKQNRQGHILAASWNSIGMVQEVLNDSASAKKSFEESLGIARYHNLPIHIGNALGNLAMFETDSRKSIEMQMEAIRYHSMEPGSEEAKALILTNVGNSMASPDSAIQYYLKALSLCSSGNLPVVEIGAYNNLASRLVELGRFREAEEYIVKKALPLAEKTNNLDWLGTLYDTRAEIMSKTGRLGKAYEYERMSMDFKAQFDAIRAADHMRLLSAMFDLKNKELTIRENEAQLLEKNSLNRTLKLTTLAGVLGIAVILLAFLGFRQKSRIRLRQQQVTSARRLIELEEAEKGRIGFELHDNIGYLVRIIDNRIKTISFPDPEEGEALRKQLGETGEAIRRISHRMNPVRQDDATLQELIADIVNDMKNLGGLKIRYFIPEVLPPVSREIVLHICRITEELLTNSGKYARDAGITLRLASADRNLLLLYSDNGPGFVPGGDRPGGIGLNSIFARVALLNGKAHLDTAPGMGVTWDISIPLE